MIDNPLALENEEGSSPLVLLLYLAGYKIQEGRHRSTIRSGLVDSCDVTSFDQLDHSSHHGHDRLDNPNLRNHLSHQPHRLWPHPIGLDQQPDHPSHTFTSHSTGTGKTECRHRLRSGRCGVVRGLSAEDDVHAPGLPERTASGRLFDGLCRVRRAPSDSMENPATTSCQKQTPGRNRR